MAFIPIVISPKCIFAQHFPEYAKGTSIIGYIKNDTIWIAADSRTISINDTTFIFNDSTCKIFQIGNYISAYAGWYFSQGTKIDYSISNIFSAFRDNSEPSEIFYNLKKNVDGGFWSFLNINGIKKQFAKDTIFYDLATGFIFPYFDDGGRARIDYYIAIPSIKDLHFIESIPFKIPPIRLDNGGIVYRLGSHNMIDNLIKKGFIDDKISTPDWLETLISAEANTTPYVGGFVDVVMITEKKITWLKDHRKEKKCN